MTPNIEECTREEKKLLKALKSKSNYDGYFELVMANNDIEKKNIHLFFNEFDDDVIVYTQIIKLFSSSTSLASFRKQMRKLAQISIREKVTSEIATYEFIKNIAFVAELAWLKEATPSRKVKVTYFFKKIEDAQGKSVQTKRRVLSEYLKESKKASNYIVKLLNEDDDYVIDTSSDTILINALNNSF